MSPAIRRNPFAVFADFALPADWRAIRHEGTRCMRLVSYAYGVCMSLSVI